jgi:hypothetical protein
LSILILNETFSEVRRLMIAGSVVAPNDFRLQKCVEPLQRAGERAPVFLRVAEAVEQVVQSSEKSAAAALLELSALLTSILYTQGATGQEGPWTDLPPAPIEMTQTATSAQMLKPLMEALTTKGGGRLEQIQSAYALGLFRDLRLIRPALVAIDDTYSEIRDLIAEKILPGYGRAIVGELRRTFDPTGKAGHARRLKLLYRIAPAEARDLVQQALERGSKEVKLVALECLGDAEEDLSYLLEQSLAKAKDLRSAALLSLGRLSHPEAQARIMQVFASRDIGLLERVAIETGPTYLVQAARERAAQDLLELLDTPSKSEQKARVEQLLRLLRMATARPIPGTFEFLADVVQRHGPLTAIRTSPGGADILSLAVEQLALGGEAEVGLLVDQRESLPPDQWPTIVRAARKTLAPEQFFEWFSPYLRVSEHKSLAGQRSAAILAELVGVQRYFHYYLEQREDHASQTQLDRRWLDFALDNDLPPLVYTLARWDHPRLGGYLTARWEATKFAADSDERLIVAQALLDARHSAATGVVLSQLEAVKAQPSYAYNVTAWCRLAGQLPTTAIPQLTVMLTDPSTSKHLSDEIADIIQTIQRRNTHA